MEKFYGTATYIIIKNHYTRVCPVYVLDAILQVNIAGPTKWEPHSHADIYLVHSPFCSGSVALVLKPATGHVSRQFHVVFVDACYIVPFMTEVIIPPNLIDLVRLSSQSGALKNISLEDTWFTPELEEYPRETLIHKPIFKLEKNRNTITLLQYVPHVQDITTRKGAPVDEVMKYP